jgi:hypothetical protein
MDKNTKREVVAALIKAGRRDLARCFVGAAPTTEQEAAKIETQLRKLFPNMFVGTEPAERGYRVEFAPTDQGAGPLTRLQTDRRVLFSVSPANPMGPLWPENLSIKVADSQTKEQLRYMGVRAPRKTTMTAEKAGEALLAWFKKNASTLRGA